MAACFALSAGAAVAITRYAPLPAGLSALGLGVAAAVATAVAVATALPLALGAVLGPGRRGAPGRAGRGGLRGPVEVEAVLGLPTLGLVPRLEAGQDPFRGPPAPYAEAVRGVLAAATEAAPGRPAARVLLVTSSLPGEGKTTLALSLAAQAAAAAGRSARVLAIDLDLRQPNIHRALGHREVGAGIVEHVAGGLGLAEIVRRDPATGIDFLPIKARAEDPTGLVEDARMARLLDEARAAYDLVVIDTAPVGIITDTRLLAPLADRVLFVARWGGTGAEAARDGVRALRDAGVEPAGVVLTQAVPGRGGRAEG